MKGAELYIQIIMEDDRGRIVSETPTIYTDDHIVRVYEFEDGAVVNYEWQSPQDGRGSMTQRFNHRFVLVKVPDPNPACLKTGTLKLIHYLQ